MTGHRPGFRSRYEITSACLTIALRLLYAVNSSVSGAAAVLAIQKTTLFCYSSNSGDGLEDGANSVRGQLQNLVGDKPHGDDDHDQGNAYCLGDPTDNHGGTIFRAG